MKWMIVGALALGLGGCNSQQLEQEKAQLELRVADLEKEKGRLEKENDALHAELRKMKDQLSAGNTRAMLSGLGLKEGGSLKAKLSTSKGDITCELWPDKAPKTVVNFVELAEGTRSWTDPKSGAEVKRPLYDGTIFHRVIPNFMIQGGDPLGNGTGGPGYQFEDEVGSGATFDRPGLLAMANAGPNTNGSQFFITDRDTPTHLNGKHTIFGKCGNLDVVQAIAEVETARGNRPVTDVVLKKVTISRE